MTQTTTSTHIAFAVAQLRVTIVRTDLTLTVGTDPTGSTGAFSSVTTTWSWTVIRTRENRESSIEPNKTNKNKFNTQNLFF